MLKDHLGNTRVMFDQNGTVLESSDYYPFGLQVARAGNTVPSPENRYKYNGKELQTELGLMQYDYGARFYDPVIARWNVVDPMAEKHFEINPYNYVMNNPMMYIDPLGLDTSKAPIKPNDDVVLDDGSVVKSALPEVRVAGQGTKEKICPTCPDPSTEGKNFFGGTYAGPNNPLDFSGDYTYAIEPIKPWDPSGIGHDRRYDNLKAVGGLSLFADTRAIGADWQFVYEEVKTSTRNDISNGEKARSYFIGTGLGLISLPKTIYKLGTPGGLSMILMWYKISNKGVTNKPNK